MSTSTKGARFAGQGGSSICEICGRRLRNPESVARGMGPVCAGRMARQTTETQAREEPTGALLSQDLREGIVIRRSPSGGLATNVPQRVTHHSPGGYEIGYGGSGPADLALNILESVLAQEGYQGPRTQCFRGDCFSLAYALHQEFKWQFIAAMPRDLGGTIGYQEVLDWIEARSTEVRELWADAV